MKSRFSDISWLSLCLEPCMMLLNRSELTCKSFRKISFVSFNFLSKFNHTEEEEEMKIWWTKMFSIKKLLKNSFASENLISITSLNFHFNYFMIKKWQSCCGRWWGFSSPLDFDFPSISKHCCLICFAKPVNNEKLFANKSEMKITEEKM